MYHPHKTFCAIEVGTSVDGGSRNILRSILAEYGEGENSAVGGGRGGSSYAIHTYEGAPSVFRRASETWPRSANLHIHNELFLTERAVNRLMLQLARGSNTNDERGLKRIDYAARMKMGESAGYLRTIPPCRADLVSIVAERHMCAGVIATVLSHE